MSLGQAMTKWHPGTKVLLAAAVAAVPYLWWTSADDPPPTAAPVARAPEPAGAAEPPGALEPYALPPLERFAGVVERPLFSPTRRMPAIEEPPPEVEAVPEGPAAPESPSGPAEPDLRFFGTVRQGGKSMALVTFPATNAVARLAEGDRVGEWQVVEVDRNRLILGIGEEQRAFQIFGPGSHARPASAQPAPESPPAAEEPLDGGGPTPEEPPYDDAPLDEMPPE